MKRAGWHAGVNTHQVSVGDGVGVAAAVMIAGSVAVLLTGSPDFWLFPVGATVLGLGISAVRSSARKTGTVPLSFHESATGREKEPL